MDFRLFLPDQTRITPEDVINFRRNVFDDMLVSLAEAEGVFALNDIVEQTCAEWDSFFVEVMIDYCVNQANPKGYVSETNAQWLVGQVTRDGRLKSDTELELLIKVMERASRVPDTLAVFALEQVAEAVLEGDGELLGDETLTPGVIGLAEAQIIRRILYAAGADGCIHVSRREAEVLFDLNDKTAEMQNHREWSDVFVRAIAAHLMATAGYQSLPKKEVLRREAWLDDDTVDMFGMLKKTFGSLKEIFDGGFGDAVTGSQDGQMEEAWRQRNGEAELGQIGAAPVDDGEAKWLIERINRDGDLHENERALIEFLKEESPNLSEELRPLVANLG